MTTGVFGCIMAPSSRHGGDCRAFLLQEKAMWAWIRRFFFGQAPQGVRPPHLDGDYLQRCLQMQRQRWAEQTATK